MRKRLVVGLACLALARCGTTAPEVASGPVFPSELPLAAPVVPLAAPVEVVSTAWGPFARTCRMTGRDIASARSPVAEMIVNCRRFNVENLPDGSARITIMPEDPQASDIRTAFTRSPAGEVSNVEVTGRAFTLLRPEERAQITQRMEIGLRAGGLRRRMVAQGDVLEYGADQRCTVAGRSTLRNRDVLVTDCASTSHVGGGTQTIRGRYAVDIQSGMTLATYERGASTTPEGTRGMAIRIYEFTE